MTFGNKFIQFIPKRGLQVGHIVKRTTKKAIVANLNNMSAQEQMRAMLDQLMGTGRDGECSEVKVFKFTIQI